MSIVRTLEGYLGVDGGVALATYECRECGNAFESAKDPERATCMDCLSTDLELIDRRNR